MQERVVQPMRTNRLPASATTFLQRKCSCGGKCASCSKKRLARKAASQSSNLPEATRIVQNVLLTGGRPLDDSIRAELEPRFRHDFSRVRLHTDCQAARSAQAVDALAYTVSPHIVFGSGQYRPETHEGRRLVDPQSCRTSFSSRERLRIQASALGDHALWRRLREPRGRPCRRTRDPGGTSWAYC